MMTLKLNARMRLAGLALAAMSAVLGGCQPDMVKDAPEKELLPVKVTSENWKEVANAGIEKYRKRDAAVTVVDAAGKPIPGATVDVVETKKLFPFGAAIGPQILNNPQWQAAFKRDFNYAVFENETKWRSNEPRQGQVNFNNADRLIKWCNDNGITMRGHCVYWEEPKQGPPAWLNPMNGEQLKAALEKRITDFATHFQGKFTDWDVNNEMMHGTFFIDKAGKDVRVWMYKRAKELAPNVRLAVNDFNVLSVDQNFKQVQTQEYVDLIKGLLKDGAPVDVAGIQGHIWTEDILAHPEVIRERLDLVASTGLPMWITEFDVADADPKVRAEKLELVYRSAFGHPQMQGLVMWVFWAGDSWRGANAALIDRNWTVNEEGKRFEALLDEWTTKASLKTDAKGTANFRGFHGIYTATITTPGKAPVTRDFTLPEGKGALAVKLSVAP